MLLRVVLVVSLALLAAWFSYWQLERLGARAWVAAACRAIAWTGLGLLLLDLTCAVPAGSVVRPLVLLDGSLSMTAAGGRWAAARDSALAWGEVRLFGDQHATGDTLPALGRSDLGPSLRAAAASDRRVLVVTDGELDDAQDLPAEALARVGVRLFPRAATADLAITRVAGPDRITAGDTIRLEATVRSFGSTADSARIEVRLDQRLLARRAVRLGRDGNASIALVVPSKGLSGDVVLSVGLAGAGDPEPRDDARLWLVRVTPTPGIVMLASPSDWDARFLLNTVREIADLPVRGYARLEAGRWRSMETVLPANTEEVAQAARRADLLIVKGDAGEIARGSRARARWNWPSGEAGETVIPGEWYTSAHGSSPIAAALLGLPVDSFPPLMQITPIEPGATDWVGLSAQLGRRGAERPVFTGKATGGRREVFTAADGLWRWRFRGGSSEQGYRALVANTISWLLAGADSAAGRARPVRPVVANGRPVLFEWTAGGPPAPLPVTVSGEGPARADTLRFDGAGRAELWLPPGRYRYAVEGGGSGLIVVDRWSEEWLPRPVALADQATPAVALAGLTSTRRWIWLFGLVILALCGEWLARREARTALSNQYRVPSTEFRVPRYSELGTRHSPAH